MSVCDLLLISLLTVANCGRKCWLEDCATLPALQLNCDSQKFPKFPDVAADIWSCVFLTSLKCMLDDSLGGIDPSWLYW